MTDIKNDIDKRKGYTSIKSLMETNYELNKKLYNQVFDEITKRRPKYNEGIIKRG